MHLDCMNVHIFHYISADNITVCKPGLQLRFLPLQHYNFIKKM